MNRISIAEDDVAARRLDPRLPNSILMPGQIRATQGESKEATGWSDGSRGVIGEIPMIVGSEDDLDPAVAKAGGKAVQVRDFGPGR